MFGEDMNMSLVCLSVSRQAEWLIDRLPTVDVLYSKSINYFLYDKFPDSACKHRIITK